MELQLREIGNGIRMIKLTGKLDIQGVERIELKFAGACAGDAPRVLVDLSGVEFMASIGIRMLVTNAKAAASRGGRLVLMGPPAEVREVLEMAGILSIIPAYEHFESAEAVLLADHTPKK